MPAEFWYGVEVLLNGLMAGVMYSLVALGFVLIFKASGIFNYAQGVMALFAAQTLVGIQTGLVPFSHIINTVFGTKIHHFGWNVPTFLAILMTIGVMVVFAIIVEKLVLKHLVNQEPIILFMATIGLAYFLEGFGDLMWGSEIKKLDIGIPQGGNIWVEESTAFLGGEDFYGFYLDTLDIYAVFAVTHRVEGIAGSDAGWVHLDPRRDHRRADHRGGREDVRIPHRCTVPRWSDGKLVRLHAGAGLPHLPSAGPVRRKNHREGLR